MIFLTSSAYDKDMTLGSPSLMQGKVRTVNLPAGMF